MSEGIVLEPGRSRLKDRKRDSGVEELGVMVNRLEANMAPSGALFVVGCICSSMTELSGKAKPRTPLKSPERGSSLTVEAAAGYHYIR